jgi:hypothetical protein
MWSETSWLILGAWVGLGLIFVGVGLLPCRLARSDVAGPDGWLLAFWIGWVATLFALQVWHLFLPVDGRALAIVAAAGLVGLVVAVATGARRGVRLGDWPPVVAFAVVACWLADHARAAATHGDSGAYFLPTIRWLADYPIIRGLANLYVPYAFNQSYFLYGALLDVGPFTRRSYHLANGLLVLAVVARGFSGLSRLLRWRRSCEPVDVFYALFLPATFQLGLGVFLTSPSPDLSLFLLGVVVSGLLIAQLSRPGSPQVFDVLAIGLLATAGVTVKLSFAGLAAVVIPFSLLVHLTRERSGWTGTARTTLALGAVVAAGLVPWVIRNVLMSGCPFYPSPVAALPVDWLVRADAIEWIMAPMHFAVTPGDLFRDPRWAYTRLDSLGWISRDVIVPSAIALAAMVVGLVLFVGRLVRRRSPASPRLSPLILLPALVSFIFVAESAPMPRYMGATFWLLAVQSVLLLMGRAAFGDGPRRRVVAGVIVLVASVALIAQKRPFLHGGPGFEIAPVPALTETRLESGLVVGIPEHAQCWNVAQPCTPTLEPSLRLRRAGDMSSGFTADAHPAEHR